MNVELTGGEIHIILFELRSALEIINKSLASGDNSFAGEDEVLMSIIQKLERAL